jgi:hypothetical protein
MSFMTIIFAPTIMKNIKKKIKNKKNKKNIYIYIVLAY